MLDSKKKVIINLGKKFGLATPLRSTWRPQSSVFRMREFDGAPKVSFCITTKNRLEQIKVTLPKNLKDNEMDRHQVEFVLVDFGSDSDIKGWLTTEFTDELDAGYLKFFTCDSLAKWHAPKAKNTAHRLSKGKILVNLDGDNFTGYRGGMFVYNQFMSTPHDVCLWQYSGDAHDGSFGRISSSRDAFLAIGGYNEEFLEMGFQDRDLVNRLEMIGAEVILDLDERYNRAIENDKYSPENMEYSDMRRYNRLLSARLFESNTVVANKGVIGLLGIQQLVREGTKYQLINVE